MVPLFLSVFLMACVAPVVNRIPSDVATSLREKPMRRMETDSLLLYYPEARKEDALRIAERLEACASSLRSQTRIHSDYSDQKMVVIVPDVPFNNAFVAPSAAGLRHFSVIPTSNTLDFTTELGMPPDPSYVGCHEIVHYVHLLQVEGIWGWMNQWLGNVISPQVGMDTWFLEGLATYYESRLQPGTGRMAWPAWRGYFHAAFASKRINGGDLSAFQRPFHWGNQYLVGSRFVEFIAGRYGEEALWKVIESQGGSILFPLGTALRWKSGTGKTLPTLIDEFADYVETAYPIRKPPKSQRRIRDAGTSARYAVARSGREALLFSSGDQPTQLRVYQEGRLLRERTLMDVLPPRTLSIASPILTSGLSFTEDGKTLYFVAIDSGHVRLQARLLRYRVDEDDLEEVASVLGGTGGSVSVDGGSYYYARTDGDRRHVAVIDLATLATKVIREAGPRAYYGEIRQSPDRSKLVASFFDGRGFRIRILDAETGKTLNEVAVQGAVHDPSWVDDKRIVLLAESEGRFQVHLFDLESQSLSRITDAPYLALQPRVHGNEVRFLNRHGWKWSIDSAPMTPLAEPTVISESALNNEVPPPVTTTLNVQSDTPYSQLDNLFLPSLTTPIIFGPQQESALVGISLAGADRLATHRWSLAGFIEMGKGDVSGSFDYGNSLFAPLQLNLHVSRFAWHKSEIIESSAQSEDRFRSQRVGALGLAYPFRGGAVGVSLAEVQDTNAEHTNPLLHKRRLSGARIGVSASGMEATRFTGRRRGYSLFADAAYFDESLSSFSTNITEVGGWLDIVTPLPLSRRHTLTLSARGRRLYGLSRTQGFLEVGGGGSPLYRAVSREGADPSELDDGVSSLPGPLFFSEPLRGFEDLTFTTNRIAIGQITYRYPLILDMGFASTAYLLPSWFFRQLDFQLFAVGATESFANLSQRRKFAAGASLDLGMSIWLVPFALRYQLARRFTDDKALVHSITIEI